MKITTLLKPGLFVYEVFKIIIFAIILMTEAYNSSIFLLAFFAAQGALFPIMALFLCLNTVRYKEYLPLFMAGKSIGIFILLVWSIFSQQSTMIGGFFNGMSLLSFELVALAAIFYIKTNFQIKEPSTETSTETNITEEN
jgi:hypothetical protein